MPKPLESCLSRSLTAHASGRRGRGRSGARLTAGALAVLAGLALAAAAAASPVATFSGAFDLAQVIAPVAGDATFDFNLSPSGLPTGDPNGSVGAFGYLNVETSGGAWLVQNQPIPLSGFAAAEQNNVWFTDFTHAVGGSPLTVSAIINDKPYASLPTPDATWTTQSVTPSAFNWAFPGSGGEAGPPLPATPPIGPPPPPDAAKIEGYLRGGVADIKQYWDECGPTSTANSLIWLAQKYKFAKKLPTKPDGSIDQQALILQLAQAMHPFTPADKPDRVLPDGSRYKDRGYPGLDHGELKDGKVKYIADNKLPLTVEGGYAADLGGKANLFDFVVKQLKKGQDVEFLIAWPNDGYHWVTVVGDINAGKDSKTLIVHNPLKANGNNYWRINDDGSLTTPLGTAAAAFAESVPEPSTWVMMLIGLGAAGATLRRRRASFSG